MHKKTTPLSEYDHPRDRLYTDHTQVGQLYHKFKLTVEMLLPGIKWWILRASDTVQIDHQCVLGASVTFTLQCHLRWRHSWCGITSGRSHCLGNLRRAGVRIQGKSATTPASLAFPVPPAGKKLCPSLGFIPGERLRRWPGIKSTLGQRSPSCAWVVIPTGRDLHLKSWECRPMTSGRE